MKRFVRGLVAAAVMSVGLAVNAALPVTGGLVCWYDAGVGVTTSDAGEILAWDDQSGLEHHGTVGGGSTVLAEDQLNSRPAAQFRSSYLDLAGPLFVKEQYLVLRSPTATWSGGGGFLCRATGRGSSYDMRNGDVTFWPDQAPAAVSKNGTAIPVEALDNSQFVVRSPSDTWTGGGAILGRRLWRSYYLQGGTTKFWQDVWPEAVSKNGTVIPQEPVADGVGYDLAPITDFMLLKITVQNDSPGTHEIGMTSGDMLSFDVAEIIGYESPLSATDENALGAYFASKYGLPFVPATAADILTFGLPGMPAVIDQSARTIAWTVPAGTDVEHLAPDYTMSPGATGYPESGVAQDFINPVQYTITGADGSTKVYVVTVTEAALAAPTGLAAVAGDATVSLDWNDTLEPGLASYRVYRSTTSGSGYEPIASGLAASAYTDIAVTNGVQYFYVVTAVNLGGGESAPSGEVFATPRGQAGTVNVNMGDVNADKSLNIADAISLLGYLFAQKAAPACAKSADANDDNALNIADAISILGYLFSGKTLKAPDGVELTSATHKGCAPYGAADIPAQVSGLPGCATQCAR